MVVPQEVMKTLQSREGQLVNGAVLCKDYSVQMTKTGKPYIVGTLQSGCPVAFKVWNNSGAYGVLADGTFKGKVIEITGTVDMYNDIPSIVISTASAVKEGLYTPDQFLETKYNAEAYYNALVNKCKSVVSEKAFDILSKILFNNEDVVKKFKLEFAASGHHDNCKSGLLAHTYKVLSLTDFVIRQYPGLAWSDADILDLVYVGAVLHDIGKTVEMDLGVYQMQSCVTHLYLGTEFISPFKADIVQAYSSEWYYNLISIVLQHHGEFDLKCKTVWSYVIHLVDCFEAKVTDLVQLMDAAPDGKIKTDMGYMTL